MSALHPSVNLTSDVEQYGYHSNRLCIQPNEWNGRHHTNTSTFVGEILFCVPLIHQSPSVWNMVISFHCRIWLRLKKLECRNFCLYRESLDADPCQIFTPCNFTGEHRLCSPYSTCCLRLFCVWLIVL